MIENTSNRDPLVHFIGLTNGLRHDDSDAYITGMEAAGQRQLVDGTELPTEGPWDELEALGFVRGETIPGDDLFVNATLPAGWKKEATDHAMWSKVVDERGVARVSIFYKAAFYDRRAFMRLDHIGPDLVSRIVYGTDPVALPACWSVLTGDERRDVVRATAADLRHMVDSAYYCEHEKPLIARAEAFLRLLVGTPDYAADVAEATELLAMAAAVQNGAPASEEQR